MQREIKFRIWYGKDKDMFYPSYMEQWGAFYETLSEIDINMQYTGLKDKNGREIYEGDIIKYEDYRSCEEPEFDIGQVLFDQILSSFMVSWEGSGMDNIDNESIEIIGNIYENPELLEK